MLDKRKLTVEAMLDELKEPVPMEFVEKFFGQFVGAGSSSKASSFRTTSWNTYSGDFSLILETLRS